MESDKKLTFEDKVLTYLSRIEVAIDKVACIGNTIKWLYEDWKNPVMTMAEQMAPQWKEQEEKERVERQLKTVERDKTKSWL